MNEWRKKSAVNKYLPKGKDKISADAVEILLGLVYDQAWQDMQEIEREKNRKPEGPYEID